MAKKQDIGRNGEQSFYCLMLKFFGAERVRKCHYYAACDFEICGKTLELKTGQSYPSTAGTKQPTWMFNIHRHGKMPSETPDFYVLRLEHIPYMGRRAVHLLFHGHELSKVTKAVTLRTLMNGDFRYAERFKDFCQKRGEFEYLASEVKP